MRKLLLALLLTPCLVGAEVAPVVLPLYKPLRKAPLFMLYQTVPGSPYSPGGGGGTGTGGTWGSITGTLADQTDLQTALDLKVLKATADITGTFACSGDVSPASIGSSQNNYNPSGLSTACVVRLTSSGSVNITGFAGGADGRLLMLSNIGSNIITLLDESGSSTAANRLILNYNSLTTNLVMYPNASAVLLYDSTAARWRLISASHNVLLTSANIWAVANNLFNDGTSSGLQLRNASDQTKQVSFDLSGISTSTARTLTFPNANAVVVAPTTCTNQFAAAITSAGAVTCASVALGSDVSGDLPLANVAQASAASKLLGRGSAAGAGDFQEITLGTNLTMTGTTLDAAGSGSGDVVGPASAADNAVARYDGTTGKLIQASLFYVSDDATAINFGDPATGDTINMRPNARTSGAGKPFVLRGGYAGGAGADAGGTLTLSGGLPTGAGTGGLILFEDSTTTTKKVSLSLAGVSATTRAWLAPDMAGTMVVTPYTGTLQATAFAPASGTAASAGLYRLANNTKTCTRNAADSGDLCAWYDGSNVYNIDGATAGTIFTLTNVAAPSTPAAGLTEVYVDSTSKNLAAKNDAGTVNHGVQTATCTNQFASAISDAGAVTCTTDTLAGAQHANQGTTTTLLHGNGAGNPSFGAVVSADLNITTTTCTNQFVSALSSAAAGTCTTATLAGAQFANQGTTTTVLHGNAAGNPSFAQVALAADVSGTLPVANGGTGLTSGTSGGVLAYTASGTIASSGALTANLPVIGGGAGVAPTVGTRSGNTTAYVTTTGTQTSGDCVKIDANGNHIANGSACGGGASFDPGTALLLYDDFLTGLSTVANSAYIGDKNWQVAPFASGTIAESAGTVQNPGEILLQSHATNDNSGISLFASGTAGYLLNAFWVGRAWSIDAVVRLGVAGDITADALWVGITETHSSITSPTGAIWIRRDTDLSDTAFIFAVCKSATAGCLSAGDDTNQKTVASSITPTDGNSYRFRISFSPTAGPGSTPLVSMRVNDETAKTFCSSGCDDLASTLPTGPLVLAVVYVTRTTTGVRSYALDYVALSGTSLTRY